MDDIIQITTTKIQDKFETIDFITEIENIVNLIVNKQGYQSTIFKNSNTGPCDIKAIEDFYTLYDEFNFKTIIIAVIKEKIDIIFKDEVFIENYEKWYVVVSMLLVLYKERDLENTITYRRYNDCGKWISDTGNTYHTIIPLFIQSIAHIPYTDVNLFDEVLKETYKDEKFLMLWIDDILNFILHFTIQNFSFIFREFRSRTNIDEYAVILQDFLEQNSEIDGNEEEFINKIAGETKENYIKIKSDITSIQILIVNSKIENLKIMIQHEVQLKKQHEKQLDIYWEKIAELLEKEKQSDEDKKVMLERLEALSYQKEQIALQLKTSMMEFQAANRLTNLFDRIVLTKKLLTDTKRHETIPHLNVLDDHRHKLEERIKLHESSLASRDIVMTEPQEVHAAHSAPSSQDSNGKKQKLSVSTKSPVSSRRPISNDTEFETAFGKVVLTANCTIKEDNITHTARLNLQTYKVDWTVDASAKLHEQSFIQGKGPDNLLYYFYSDNSFKPVMIDFNQIYNRNVLTFNTYTYIYVCGGKPFIVNNDASKLIQFTSEQPDVTFYDKKCNLFFIYKSTNHALNNYLFTLHPFQRYKIFWFPDNIFRYYNKSDKTFKNFK